MAECRKFADGAGVGRIRRPCVDSTGGVERASRRGRALGECGGSGVRGDVEAARLYAAMYAGRAVPLGLAVSAVAWAAPDERATALLLGLAVAAQIADVVAAVANRLKGMAVGAAFAALVHATALAATL